MWVRYLLWLLPLCTVVVSAKGPAVSLQNADGQYLHFLRLNIQTALFGPFALVENEMVFQNPENRRVEGRFSFALPISEHGQAMPSRFAMQIGANLMEGEVVDRAKAQKVYRDILHEARDPALLEQAQGNLFTARVFPIEANAMVRLILTYAMLVPMQAGTQQRQLTVPLAGLPKLYEFSFSAQVGNLRGELQNVTCSVPVAGELNATVDDSGLTRFSASLNESLTPGVDAVITVVEPEAEPSSVFSVDGARLVSTFVVTDDMQQQVLAAEPNAINMSRFEPPNWVVYVDSSASTADSMMVRLPLVKALLDGMPDATVTVFAFDIEVAEIRPMGAKDGTLGTTVKAALEERLPLGATDMEMLLGHVRRHVATIPGSEKVGVLILSDCLATANEKAAAKLGQLLKVDERTVVELGVIGNKFDSAIGSALASAGNGRIVRIPLTSKNVASVVSTAWSDFTKPLGMRGALQAQSGWVWPPAAFDLHVGDEVIVFSGGSTGMTETPPALVLGNNSHSVAGGTVKAATAAFSSLLGREATRANLEMMEADRQLATSKTAAEDLRLEIVKLSEQSRVQCPHTAMLVLETEEDYVRFDIKRDSLRPLLVVTDSGVALRDRKDIVLPALPSQTLPPSPPPAAPTPATPGDCTANSTNSSCPDSEEDEDEDDSENKEMADANMAQGDGASTSHCVGRSSVNWLLCLLLLLLPLVLAEGEGWTDLNTQADLALKELEGKAPTERRRDLAMKYCSALWTKRQTQDLRAYASQWIMWDPMNGLAYEYLSKAGQHLSETTLALRAATSIAEVAPRDAEQLLRGAWLALSLGIPEANTWARRFAARSLEERADNPNTYRALALAAWKDGDYGTAASAYADGLKTTFESRYGDVRKVLRQEAAAFLRTLEVSKPGLASELANGALKGLVDKSYGKSALFRVTLSWLTDANDVDLHIMDPDGKECYYGNKETAAGLILDSDQTAGLGPEVIEQQRKTAGTYRVGVKYFSAGAMGASRGTVVYQKFENGAQIGEPVIEVFTLPAGIGGVQPVMEFTLK
eukprot:TRINITY_DN53905_c0_g2_i4.p1 TRINITY_DN53905_c0_g2~~TRINITY_DN53905_c0_g2_i4.p1  ORF type:complete len:1041 (+),score=216.71 TRINITY_DN53905_c0_g2_i4:65-3187(+)